MLKKNSNTENRNTNEQPIAEAGALQVPATGCSACLISRRGQQVIEYAVLITAISMSLLVMYVYSKRGIQAVVKVSADQIGPQADSQPLQSGDPTDTTSSITTLTNETRNMNSTNEDRYYDFQSLTTSAGNEVTVTTIH